MMKIACPAGGVRMGNLDVLGGQTLWRESSFDDFGCDNEGSSVGFAPSASLGGRKTSHTNLRKQEVN